MHQIDFLIIQKSQGRLVPVNGRGIISQADKTTTHSQSPHPGTDRELRFSSGVTGRNRSGREQDEKDGDYYFAPGRLHFITANFSLYD
jgi:hypothetical protein